MTHQDLMDLGSQLEAHATMAPGAPIQIDPMRVAHMLMWAAREIEILKGMTAQLTEARAGEDELAACLRRLRNGESYAAHSDAALASHDKRKEGWNG